MGKQNLRKILFGKEIFRRVFYTHGVMQLCTLHRSVQTCYQRNPRCTFSLIFVLRIQYHRSNVFVKCLPEDFPSGIYWKPTKKMALFHIENTSWQSQKIKCMICNNNLLSTNAMIGTLFSRNSSQRAVGCWKTAGYADTHHPGADSRNFLRGLAP